MQRETAEIIQVTRLHPRLNKSTFSTFQNRNTNKNATRRFSREANTLWERYGKNEASERRIKGKVNNTAGYQLKCWWLRQYCHRDNNVICGDVALQHRDITTRELLQIHKRTENEKKYIVNHVITRKIIKHLTWKNKNRAKDGLWGNRWHLDFVSQDHHIASIIELERKLGFLVKHLKGSDFSLGTKNEEFPFPSDTLEILNVKWKHRIKHTHSHPCTYAVLQTRPYIRLLFWLLTAPIQILQHTEKKIQHKEI